MTREELAKQYFMQGYNCSQSIVLAFKDLIHLEEKDILKIASPFGGGMGRLRETCGALSGCFIVLGYLYGNDSNDIKKKEELYKKVQIIGNRFKEKNHFLSCRKLLSLDHKSDSYIPSERTEEYYKTRPCINIIMNAAKILDEFILSCD